MQFDIVTTCQNTEEWRHAHRNRITSSLAHKLHILKTNKQKAKLAEQIRNGYQKKAFEPIACFFGRIMEPKAIAIYFYYIKKIPKFHHSKLKRTGLLTLKDNNFIGTSPDCVLCVENGEIPVEVKVSTFYSLAPI